jgi:hypothetical protein
MTSVERRPSLVLTFTRDVTFVQPGYPISSTPKTLSRQKGIKYKPHIFANTQNCWQHYITHLRYQPVFPISDSLFKYKKKRYTEILKFHLLAHQRKHLRTPAIYYYGKQIKKDETCEPCSTNWTD